MGLFIFMRIEMEGIHGIKEIMKAIISQTGCFPKIPKMSGGEIPRGSWVTESPKRKWNLPSATPERGWDS